MNMSVLHFRLLPSLSSVPPDSRYFAPLTFIEEAIGFISSEIVSERVESELRRWSSIFRWIQEDSAKTYFELVVEPPDFLTEHVDLIATKTYARGLILISIYSLSSIFFVIQDGEGDQPLLDVSFPNVSHHGQGLLIASYFDTAGRYKKMTLWFVVKWWVRCCSDQCRHNLDFQRPRALESADAKDGLAPALTRKTTVDISSKEYVQTYCIRKSEGPYHDATLASEHEVGCISRHSWRVTSELRFPGALSLW